MIVPSIANTTISRVRRKRERLPEIFFELLCVDKLIVFAVGNIRAVDAAHHIFAVFVKAPIALIHIVVGSDTVYYFNIKSEFAVVACDEIVLKKRITESFLVGVDCKGY